MHWYTISNPMLVAFCISLASNLAFLFIHLRVEWSLKDSDRCRAAVRAFFAVHKDRMVSIDELMEYFPQYTRVDLFVAIRELVDERIIGRHTTSEGVKFYAITLAHMRTRYQCDPVLPSDPA